MKFSTAINGARPSLARRISETTLFSLSLQSIQEKPGALEVDFVERRLRAVDAVQILDEAANAGMQRLSSRCQSRL